MANKTLLLQLIKQMKDYLNKMEKFKDIGETEFEKDWTVYWAIDHGLHLSIQVAIDIAKEIISIQQLPKPRKYVEAFLILYRRHVITHEVLKQMQILAVFRNRLIHEYLYMDPKEIYRIYKNKRKYLYRFAKEVVKWLDKQ